MPHERTVHGFGGFVGGVWVETVPAVYTTAEATLVRSLIDDGYVHEAAWLHGLKAAFDARIVGCERDDYAQGALL